MTPKGVARYTPQALRAFHVPVGDNVYKIITRLYPHLQPGFFLIFSHIIWLFFMFAITIVPSELDNFHEF